jgi:ABC-type transport system involved in multi-copper enzyme maturation permease subunit
MFRHIWKKEIQGELYTWKSMLWLLIAALLFSVTSYLLLTNKELSLLDQTELLWLLGKVIVGVGLLIVAVDASSIITSEFEKETAESLFVSPLKLKDFIVGKLLAVLTLWAAIFVVSIPYILVTSAGSHLALAFIAYVALLGTLGILGFTFLIFAVSLLFRSSKNTLTTSLILLLGLSIPAVFTSTLKTDVVSQIISKVNPIDTIFSSLDNVLVDYQLSLAQNWQYLLPLIIFCVLTLGLLIFSMRHFEKKGVISNE